MLLVLPGLETKLPTLMLLITKSPVSLMLEHSFFPKLPSTCTAGDKTLLLLPSYNLTVKTDSLNAKELTSTLSNLSNTTHATPQLVSIFTHSLFAPKNTNLPEHVISPELITPLFNSFFPTPLLKEPRLPRFVSMPLTTMSSVSCLVWVVLPTPIKHLNWLLSILFYSLIQNIVF
jgi:hypothetical protein